MKAILLTIASLAAMSASAVSLTPLATPSAVPSAYPARTACIATAFNADDSSNGTCEATYASASSGRGGHPTYTNYVYTASWDVNGSVLNNGTYCGKLVVNAPYFRTWTYATGFNATTCYVPNPGTNQVSLYDPSLGFDAWFFYLSTSADGTHELIAQGVYGFIYEI